MSRILRRPMFRGGRVDSRGTGIASGLGYEKGGRVGYWKDQQGGVVLGKDLMDNMWSGTPKSKDYIKDQKFYEKYKIRSEEDLMKDYEDMMQQKEEDLLMTMGLDDYSGFQNMVAEDLSHYRDPEGGMKKFFHDEKAKDDAARIAAAKVGIKLPELINSQTEELPQELTPAQLENIELRKLLEERMKKGTPEEEIEKNKKIFQKAYGSGVPEDASRMLLSAASRLLEPEATVKSGLGKFFGDESKVESKRGKYKDAATTAAINAYLTGQKTLAEVETYLAKVKAGKQIEYDLVKQMGKDMTLNEYVRTHKKSGDRVSQTLESGIRDKIQNFPTKYKSFKKIKSKHNTEDLLDEEYLGMIFWDEGTTEIFAVVMGAEGKPVKEPLY
jgi:hypothetical protein